MPGLKGVLECMSEGNERLKKEEAGSLSIASLSNRESNDSEIARWGDSQRSGQTHQGQSLARFHFSIFSEVFESNCKENSVRVKDFFESNEMKEVSG